MIESPSSRLKNVFFLLFSFCNFAKETCVVISFQQPVWVGPFVPIQFFFRKQSKQFSLYETFIFPVGEKEDSHSLHLFQDCTTLFVKHFCTSMPFQTHPPTFKNLFNPFDFDTPNFSSIFGSHLFSPNLSHFREDVQFTYTIALVPESEKLA